MATFSCRKCSLLFPSYAVCFSHLLDTPAHEIDRAAATAESGRRGFRSAIEGMMTIMIPADAALTRATIVAGRDAIEDQADPVPRPVSNPPLYPFRANPASSPPPRAQTSSPRASTCASCAATLHTLRPRCCAPRTTFSSTSRSRSLHLRSRC